MPRSTHARRTRGGLPSSPDKIFQCLWELEDYVHPRPGQAEPFLSLCLSFWPQMLFSLCKSLGGFFTWRPPFLLPRRLPSRPPFGQLSLVSLPQETWAGWELLHLLSPSHLRSALPKPGEMIFPLAPQGFSLLHFPSLHRRGCGLRVFHSISFFIIFTPFGWFASEGLGGLTGQSDFIMSPSSSYH